MSFRRTISGLNNQHLFYGVDYIVYLEGGISYNKHEIYAGMYTEESEDVIFWRGIFNRFGVTKKMKFKSVGSKTTIKEIVSDIIQGQVSSVIVAMDNEFDEALQLRISHPQVFYAHGYSWENDVWDVLTIKQTIESLIANKVTNNEIEDNFADFIKKIRLAVYADGYLFKKQNSFFPRSTGHMFCIEMSPLVLPTVKVGEIHNKVNAKGLKKGTIYAFGKRYSISAHKFCYGHFLADYGYQLISRYIKIKHSLTTISKEIVNRLILNQFFQQRFQEGPIYDYHLEQFNSKNQILGLTN
ncbi:MAG: DUF4435 domain-containing protein [Chitinophagales bacterium]|nr:DUF4435 domain-containing protein [Chitinophagales bacterium]